MPFKYTNGIHERLKQDTQSAHQKLDHHPYLLKLVSDKLCTKSYAEILNAKWFGLAESNIHQHLLNVNDIAHIESKQALINKDIMALQSPIEHTSTPSTCALPLASNLHQALGVLYVVEGSTLGGQIIAPRVIKALGRTDVCAFYQCYGANKLTNFKNTLTFIQQNTKNEEQVNQVVEGAKLSFESLYQYLSDWRLLQVGE